MLKHFVLKTFFVKEFPIKKSCLKNVVLKNFLLKIICVKKLLESNKSIVSGYAVEKIKEDRRQEENSQRWKHDFEKGFTLTVRRSFRDICFLNI